MEVWRNTAAGFALGPERVLEFEDGRRVKVSAYWTDEDGVCVAVDAGNDPLPSAAVERVAVSMIQLAALPAPEPDAGELSA
jgi:hypothetical protein